MTEFSQTDRKYQRTDSWACSGHSAPVVSTFIYVLSREKKFFCRVNNIFVKIFTSRNQVFMEQ